MTSHQEDDARADDRMVIVHRAETSTEAVVLRGLLRSAGIHSPPPVVANPFPLRHHPAGMPGAEILVLESLADEARQLISDYLAAAADTSAEDLPEAEE